MKMKLSLSSTQHLTSFNVLLPPPSADRDIVALCPQDLGHHGAPGSPEGEAAAHRAAAGREGPGASRDGQGHQPHLRGGEGAGCRQGAARAGTTRGRGEKGGGRGGRLWQLTRPCRCVQYVSENESSLQQVRAMLANTQKDKLELANQLEEERRFVTLTALELFNSKQN